MGFEEFPKTKIENSTEKIEEKEELSDSEQIEQEKNGLLQEIDSAIEKQNDGLFEQEANHIKEIIEKGLNKATNEERGTEFMLNFIKYMKLHMEELERVCDPKSDMIANKETRIKHWKELADSGIGLALPDEEKEEL